MRIPFNKSYRTGREMEYIGQAMDSGLLAGNGSFGKHVTCFMKNKYSFREVFLTPSCTAALEMGALLADIQPGDEVILPSYTFSSSVNAVLIFGAKPVFCEVSPDTMNIDVAELEKLITPKTKMIIPIDYAGVPCEIDKIMDIANSHGIIVMQDAAQAYGTRYKGEPVGNQAHLTCFSFHETKNYSSGEGGALVVNVPGWVERASYLQEKGTDRSKVLEGIQSRYSWIDKGSSYLMSDILAAMLLAQLEKEDEIKQQRSLITRAYKEIVAPYEANGYISTMKVNEYQEINHHAFWVLLKTPEERSEFIRLLGERGITAYIGYVPLHSSKMGNKLGYKAEDLALTEDLALRIARLPFFTDLPKGDLEFCTRGIDAVLKEMFQKKEVKNFS